MVFMTVHGSSRNKTIRMQRNAHDIILLKMEKIGFILTGEMDFIVGGDGCTWETSMHG